MAKNPKITGWKSLWKNLEWGPRGALIAFVLTTLYLFVPLIPRVLISIIVIFLMTLLGSLAGMLLEWLVKQTKKKK